MINPRNRMPWQLRAATYVVFTAVWLSGCLWFVLQQFFAEPGEFGTLQHRWQPSVLLIHGVIGVLSLYLLGWLSSRHIAEVWEESRRRASGIALILMLLVLSITGFALFFVTNDGLRGGTATVHEIIGLIVTAFAIEHWFFGKSKSKSKRD